MTSTFSNVDWIFLVNVNK